MLDISCSLVTYHNKKDDIRNVINSLKKTTIRWELSISDNSVKPLFKDLEENQVRYYHNDSNLGFGAGHNKIIDLYKNKSKYHLIINPDVYFDEGVLETLFDLMEAKKDVTVMAPKISYPNGEIQNSIRLLPSPFDLILRRSRLLRKLFSLRVKKNNLDKYNFKEPLEVNFLLGCFLMCRMTSLQKIGGFDERFFLYMEDFDLVRRLSKIGKAIIYPRANIYHVYDRGATKKVTLLITLIHSAFKYFNKYGWMDVERKRLNRQILKQLNSIS